KFNGQNLLDGTLGGQNFQAGANAGELITVNGMNFQTHVYGNNRVYSKAADVSGEDALTDKITVAGCLGSSGAIDLKGKSAREAAALVNEQSGKTGVTASAKTEALFTAKEKVSYSLRIKSSNSEAATISFATGGKQDADGYAAAINAFNAVSARTGVTAEYSSELGGIKLTNAAGESISIGQVAGDGQATLANLQYDSATDKAAKGTAAAIAATKADGTDFDTKAIAAVGTVIFDSQAGFSITGGGTTDFYSNAESSKLKTVASLDVSSFNSAQLAIAICDAAINTIDKEMSRYGALQSRFESTISNLEVNVENTSNARSRIQDADYASETAELSRATILQQAGTAMLAQANQRPQMVLSLIG
ncbi:MAG: flagellin, partial [Oxalobacter formigenes]|nr:flagellin [Oxalobacter formigenes]